MWVKVQHCPLHQGHFCSSPLPEPLCPAWFLHVSLDRTLPLWWNILQLEGAPLHVAWKVPSGFEPRSGGHQSLCAALGWLLCEVALLSCPGTGGLERPFGSLFKSHCDCCAAAPAPVEQAVCETGIERDLGSSFWKHTYHFCLKSSEQTSSS